MLKRRAGNGARGRGAGSAVVQESHVKDTPIQQYEIIESYDTLCSQNNKRNQA